ncbi:hypothetical protein O988_01843 [Pseudogymnoascus sp. VKM F-3808]|nr:hypothetical protein O988_01843 [Pseudogymnoascus sp. VKM F-3808]
MGTEKRELGFSGAANLQQPISCAAVNIIMACQLKHSPLLDLYLDVCSRGCTSSIRYARVQAQDAVWTSPAEAGTIEANTIDSVLVDWTSTLPRTILRILCQNKTNPDHPISFFPSIVESTGPYEFKFPKDPEVKLEFPLTCRLNLGGASAEIIADCPAAIVYSSNAAVAAKTVSQTRATSSVSATVKPSPSLPPSITPSSVPPLSAASSTTDPPPQSTKNGSGTDETSTPTTDISEQSSPPPTKSSEQVSSLPTTSSDKSSDESSDKSSSKSSDTSSESPSGATTASDPNTPTGPNNLGPIIGAAIGGVGLISFIILAVLFLRKFQRNRGAVKTESTRRSFYLFNAYNKRGPKARTSGVFEKDGDYGPGIQEKEGSDASSARQVFEKDGDYRQRVHEKDGDYRQRVHEKEGDYRQRVHEKEGDYGQRVHEKEGSDASSVRQIYELPENQRERRYTPVELPANGRRERRHTPVELPANGRTERRHTPVELPANGRRDRRYTPVEMPETGRRDRRYTPVEMPETGRRNRRYTPVELPENRRERRYTPVELPETRRERRHTPVELPAGSNFI